MTRFTVHDALGLQDLVHIDDLLVMPHPRLPNISEGFALNQAGVLDLTTAEHARNYLVYQQIDEQTRYGQAMQETGKEPAWVAQLPLHAQAHIRWSYATRELDQLQIVNTMPNTGLCYMVVEDGLCEAVARVFNLLRLQGVNQLGFLQAPWVVMGQQSLLPALTHTTRWLHSLDVMCVGSVMCRNLGIKGRKLNTARAAFLSHDRGTPAGGDSVKLVDLPAFDEDANYARLLKERTDRQQWREVKQRFGIDEQLLVQTILNQGLLGQVLDVADKLSYVARDIETCLNVSYSERDEDVYVGTRALKEILVEHTHVCGVWDAVRREGERLVFTDVRRLIAFLKVRIVLFRELYYHPRARFGEYLISRVLVKRLYEEGIFTRDMLLEMSDHELRRRLNEAYGDFNILRSLSLKSKVESFKTSAEALAFAGELRAKGNPFSLVEDHLHALRPGTHFLVDSPRGAMPLSDAYPGDARELWEMANMLPAVHVYYVSDDEQEGGQLGKFLKSVTQAAG